MSAAGQSLSTKPDAPAARAAPGEMRPAPEMSRTPQPGHASRSCSAISGPDSSPTKSSTSATSGSSRLVSAIASCALRALRQRSTHGCCVSISRKPQCTTSWSSTTSTLSRRVEEGSAGGAIDKQPHLPSLASARPELDDPADLEGLQRGQAKSHAPRLPALAPHAVVDDLEQEVAVVALHPHVETRGVGVLAGVAGGLAQHGLGQRLELVRDGGRVAGDGDLDVLVLRAQVLERAGERRRGRAGLAPER